jgi:serine/threonine protein phosphatase 1
MNVKTIELQGSSRCFVVGDVAGHFGHLTRLINTLDLNPKTDKLVLNGNFLGLAPSSRQVLPWLEKDWVVAILGINESRILDRLNGVDVPTLAGQWMGYLSEHDKAKLKDRLQGLPVALEVFYAQNHAVVSHAPLARSPGWSEQRERITQWAGPAHKVFEFFESRLLGLTALGHLKLATFDATSAEPLSVSSIAMEKPLKPLIRQGHYVFLVGSAHMSHGSQYAQACLLPYVELSTLTKLSTEEMIWKGCLDIHAK